MGLALELFLLMLIVIYGAAALALFLMRDIWKRIWSHVIKIDRAESVALQERKVEMDQRIRAERELEECLGENISNSEGENLNIKTHLKWSRQAAPLEEKNESVVQKTDDRQ